MIANTQVKYRFVVERSLDNWKWVAIKSFDDFDYDNAVHKLKACRDDDRDGEYRLIREKQEFEVIDADEID